MASITVLSCIALLTGFALSVTLGAKVNASSLLSCVVDIAFTGIILGIALTFAAGITHALCEKALGLCIPTTDTTVWSVSYPLVAVPVYWAILFFTSRASKRRVEALPTEENKSET